MTHARTPLLRLAVEADAERVFQWRNDPWIVSLGTSGRTVSWEEHRAWFASVLDRTRYLLFLVTSADALPAGIVRLDRVEDDGALLAIYLLEAFTGRGLGPRAIAEACQVAFASWPPLRRICAYIRSGNQPSIKAFGRCGFALNPTDPACPNNHVAMVRLKV